MTPSSRPDGWCRAPECVASGPDFRLETFESREREFILALHGEFDLCNGSELGWELARLQVRGARRVVVDLTSTTFIDASTLAQLVSALEALGSADALVLVCVDREILKVLEITRLDLLFTVFRTRAQALAERPVPALCGTA